MRVTSVPKAPRPDDFKAVIQELGFPKLKGEQTPDCIRRAADALGITERHARSYWYGQIEYPDPHLYRRALELIEAKRAEAPTDEIEELRAELSTLRAALLETRARLDRVEGNRGRQTADERRSLGGLFGKSARCAGGVA